MSDLDAENRYQELAHKWLDKTITPEEQAEFAAWYNSDQDTPIDIPQTFAENEEELRERILFKIKKSSQLNNNKRKIVFRWLSVAATFFLITTIGIKHYLYVHHRIKQNLLTKHKPSLPDDVKPGSN